LVWRLVDRLLQSGIAPRDIVAHRIEPLVARRLRETGRNVPPWLLEAERRAAIVALAVPVVLRRVRDVCGGEIIVLKGPETAAAYRDPSLRIYWDVDLLVPDAAQTQEELIAAGFAEIGNPDDYLDLHHLRPLRPPGLPLAVEVHDRPKWVDGLRPPEVIELIDAVRPSATGVVGLSAISPEHQAVTLAVHAWAHEPFRRLRDLIDLALVSGGADSARAAELADRWGVSKVWHLSQQVADAVLQERPLPRSTRIWMRSLHTGRERSVLESHLQRWFAPFAALPRDQALRALGGVLHRELMPDNEPWSRKLSRSLRALRHLSDARSEHDEAIGRRAEGNQ
jgi:hypothetical protein